MKIKFVVLVSLIILIWLISPIIGVIGNSQETSQIYLPLLQKNYPNNPDHTSITDQIGGTSNSLDIQNQFAYLATGARVTVMDISNPLQPQWIGQTSILPGTVDKVRVVGQFAYVTYFNKNGYELWIFNISNPANPIEMSHTGLPYIPISIDVNGEFAYVGLVNGMVVIQITNPAAPIVRGMYFTSNVSEFMRSVSIGGNTAYLVSDGKINIINISDPDHPSLQTTYSLPNAISVAARTSRIYVLAGWKLHVFNSSNPLALVQIGVANLTQDNWGSPMHMRVNGSYIYAGCNALHIIDISNETAPKEIGYLVEWSKEIAWRSNKLFLAHGFGGMDVVDITNPTKPEIVHQYIHPGIPAALAINGANLLVSDDRQLTIYDISEPGHPSEVGNYQTSPGYYHITDIVLPDHYAYLSAQTILILDVSNIKQPIKVKEYYLDGYSPQALAFQGTYVYSVSHEIFFVLDVTNPSDPVTVGRLNISLTNASGGRGIAVNGDYAYLTDGLAGLHVIDISTPSDPQIVSTFDTPGDVTSVLVRGSYAYLTERQDGNSGGGVRILNISDPLHVSQVGVYNDYSIYGGPSVDGMDISGNTALVADWSMGLQIVDITNPASPYTVETLVGNSSYATNVLYHGKYAYVAWSERGLITVFIDR